jgi:branched-chain amino acid transport system substrate-binding protein
MKKNKVVAFAAALAVAVSSASAIAPASANTTLKIAYQGPLTGPEAQTGLDGVRGVKLALKLYNAKKPAVKVEIYEADDQGDGANGANVAAGVAADSAVVGVLTAYSGPTFSALPAYKAAGIVIVSPSATNADLTDPTKGVRYGGPIFHRIVSNDKTQGLALARLATSGVKNPTVFIVGDQSSYSDGLTSFVKEALGSAFEGEDLAAKGTTDFAATISKIRSAKANVVIYTGYYADGAKFAKQLRDRNYKGIFAAGDGVLNSRYPSLAGKRQSEGTRMTAPTVPLEVASPTTAAAFKKEFKADPGVYTTEAFTATNMILEAITKGNTTRAGVLSYIKNIKYKDFTRTVSFGPTGDLPGAGLINAFVVRNGKIVLTGKA